MAATLTRSDQRCRTLLVSSHECADSVNFIARPPRTALPASAQYGSSSEESLEVVMALRQRSRTSSDDGASRTRTGDLLGAIQALSQLSYSPAVEAVYRRPRSRLLAVAYVVGDAFLERLKTLEQIVRWHRLLWVAAEQPRRRVDCGLPGDLLDDLVSC